MSGVFISYRREDCPGHAGRLYDRLVERFGAQRVFMDIDAIEPGVDFGERIEEAVGSCDVLLALIGRDWLAAGGRRRLDDPADFVRLELAAGLARSGLRVIPVLVEGASMPRADELPEEVSALSRRNAFELSDARWRHDVSRLIDVLGRVSASAEHQRRAHLRATARRLRVPAAALALAAVAAAAVLALDGGRGGTPPPAKAIVGPVPVGSEAGQLAFGAGAVWVPVGGTPLGVARVDPRTLRVDLIPGVGSFPASVSTGEGAIWVADSQGDRVTRIDARSGAVSSPIRVGDEPNDIAVGEGFVWTANCACSSPSSGSYSVSRIDPRTRRETRIRIEGGAIGIGTGGGNVWVTGGASGTVQRLDPRAAQVVGAPIHLGGDPTDVVVDANGIWVSLATENSVARIDPRTFRVRQRIPVGAAPANLAFGGGYLWVAHHDDGTLRRIDPRLGRVTGTAIAAGKKAQGVAFGAGRAWVVDFASGALRGVAP